MGLGLAPIGIIDREIAVDGRPAGPPLAFRVHDTEHLKRLGPRKTWLTIEPDEYFLRFREKLRAVKSIALRETIEARWYFIYHEEGSYYGTSGIEGHVKGTRAEFISRLGRGDIDDFTSGIPDERTVLAADEWLLGFAKEMKERYGRR
jgi:hypothetical protein